MKNMSKHQRTLRKIKENGESTKSSNVKENLQKSKKISKDSIIIKIQWDNIEKSMKIINISKNQVKLEKGQTSPKNRKHSHMKEHLEKSQKTFKKLKAHGKIMESKERMRKKRRRTWKTKNETKETFFEEKTMKQIQRKREKKNNPTKKHMKHNEKNKTTKPWRKKRHKIKRLSQKQSQNIKQNLEKSINVSGSISENRRKTSKNQITSPNTQKKLASQENARNS